MVFRRNLRPINSRKNVVEQSSIVPAVTNTILDNLVLGVDQADLAVTEEVTTGSKVGAFFVSIFIISEGGELANEVPLVNWYLFHDRGSKSDGLFDASGLPTPGAQGTHVNKKDVIHSEQGLAGGGELSLAGVPMIFKGVIRIPRGMQRIGVNDRFRICIRTNFASKVCSQVIYKWFS